jgi:hypothetical protein
MYVWLYHARWYSCAESKELPAHCPLRSSRACDLGLRPHIARGIVASLGMMKLLHAEAVEHVGHLSVLRGELGVTLWNGVCCVPVSAFCAGFGTTARPGRPKKPEHWRKHKESSEFWHGHPLGGCAVQGPPLRPIPLTNYPPPRLSNDLQAPPCCDAS